MKTILDWYIDWLALGCIVMISLVAARLLGG